MNRKKSDYDFYTDRWFSLENFKDEEWKDVTNYENLYMVSSYGRIKSLTSKRILSFSINRGYAYVKLSKHGVMKSLKVHRLVAISFIPNPNNLPDVNHIDENKLNNNLSNIEWCSKQYNSKYGTRNVRTRIAMRKNGRAILRYSTNGEFIKKYQCTKDIEYDGFDRRAVYRVCKGITRQYNNSVWRFENEPFALPKHKRYIEVYKYTIDGVFVEKYNSIKEAEKDNNINNKSIRYLKIGERKNPKIKGYIYSFYPINL